MEALKRAAEEQMRRRAPDLAPDSNKRQKTEAADGVDRFAYAAADALASGSRGFLVTCGFRREKTSTKEATALLQPQLPEGTAIQLVKVGCRGVVVLLAPSLDTATPVAVVGRLLQQLDGGTTDAAKSCQRIIPIQSTAALTESGVSAAAQQLFEWYVQHSSSSSASTSQEGAEGCDTADPAAAVAAAAPVRFAVAFKQRGLAAAGDDKPDDQQANPPSSQQPSSGSHAQPAAEAVPDDGSDGGGTQQAPTPPGLPDGSAAAAAAPAVTAAAAAVAPGEEAPALDKGRAIQLLAQHFAAACKGWREAKVDLRKPEVVIVAEVVPMARQHNVLALAVVPAGMVSAAQKLQIRPLGGK